MLSRSPPGHPTYPIAITGIGRSDPEYFTGKRGFKFLSAATRHAVAAADAALADAELRDSSIYPPESRGVVVGTNFGVHDVLEAMDGVVLSQGADGLAAIETPNFSVNIPAGHVSMKCRFLAFNITLTDMLVAGVEAVMVGAQSIRNGRAKLVLAGATEGPVPAAAAALLGGAAPDGAACMLTLEPLPAALSRGARVHAQIGAHLLCFIPPDAARGAASWMPYEERLRRKLDGALGDQEALRLVTFGFGGAFVDRVNESFQRHLQDRHIAIGAQAPEPAAAIASVSPLVSLADAIARHDDAVLIVASPQGHIALLSLQPVRGQRARSAVVGAGSAAGVRAAGMADLTPV